jgi:Zn-dependent peptidase ImmA (M78 family)/transcriptional regulator with XRE-family HTH domain
MTIGVNGFIGERLTEAREARGLMTQTALADLLKAQNVSVTKSAISLYENNLSDPRPEMVGELAKLLGVKESFFFLSLPKMPSNPIFWRSRQMTIRDKRTIAERKFGWSKWIIDQYLKNYMDMPPLQFPGRNETSVPNNPANLTDDQIEEIANIARQFWGLGKAPIDNMIALLENNGIMLTYGTVNSEKLDAFSNKSEYDCSYHIFLSTDKKSAVRTRFDAAHELGHLILHSHLPKSYFTEKNHSLIERQAYRFASAFLMPKDSFRRDVWMTSIEAFKVLKEQWKVSVGAIIHRCDDIGLFGHDETKAQRLWIKYKREWKTIEEDNFDYENPQLMKRCIDALLEAKVKTKSQILFDIPFSQHDIESLLNLPEDYLSEDFGELRHFPTVRVKPPEKFYGGGEVISLEDRRKGS